jgi:hypothetical protein
MNASAVFSSTITERPHEFFGYTGSTFRTIRQQYLDGGTAVAEASVGEGKVALLGPEVNFRDHPHATYKLLFNGLYYGSAKPAQVLKGPLP